MRKTILSTLILIIILVGCSTPEEERKLKEQYDKLEALVQAPEAKKAIRERYKEALEQLRNNRKDKEEMSKIFYSKDNDVTEKLFAFCDELLVDRNYNPAKFQVKQKEFKWKSVSLKGRISYIVSKDDSHYFVMYYKKEKVWFESSFLYSLQPAPSLEIIFSFDFDKPEDIMNLKEGEEVSVEAVYNNAFKESYDKYYYFNFFNPVIKTEDESK